MRLIAVLLVAGFATAVVADDQIPLLESDAIIVDVPYEVWMEHEGFEGEDPQCCKDDEGTDNPVQQPPWDADSNHVFPEGSNWEIFQSKPSGTIGDSLEDNAQCCKD